MLRQLLVRASNPRLYGNRDQVVDILKSLTRLRQSVGSRDLRTVHQLSLSFIRLAKQDPTVTADVLQGVRIDPKEPTHGRSAALWAFCFSKVDCDELVWDRCVTLFEAGLSQAAWEPADARAVLQHIAYWGSYPPSLPAAVERYVAARAESASPTDVPLLAAILGIIEETRSSHVLAAVAIRAAVVAESLTPAGIGSLCQSFMRCNNYKYLDLLIALQEQSIRMAEECTAAAAIHFLSYSLLYEAEYLDLLGLKCIVEKIVTSCTHTALEAEAEALGDAIEAGGGAASADAEAAAAAVGSSSTAAAEGEAEAAEEEEEAVHLAQEQITALLKLLRGMPKELHEPLKSERLQLLSFISLEVASLFSRPEADGGLSVKPVDAMQALVSRYVHLVRNVFFPLQRNQYNVSLTGNVNASDPATAFEAKREAERRRQEEELSAAEDGDGDKPKHRVVDASDELEEGEMSAEEMAGLGGDAAAAAEGEEGSSSAAATDDVSIDYLPNEVHLAFAKMAAFVEKHVEAIVDDDSPPFGLIPNMFTAGTDRTRRCALAIISEAAAQGIYFPTVQTYRFLLELADHNLFERRALFHLRRQFAISAEGIPMIQLVTALRCFVRGKDALTAQVASGELEVEEEVEIEEDLEHLQDFLQFCDEAIAKQLSAGGLDVRCTLAAIEHLYLLEYRDKSFMETMITYLNTKVDHASPEIHSQVSATVCQEALDHLLEGYPKVAAFLAEVADKGEVEDVDIRPSDWMNKNDPSNFITPLTEEQEQGWDVLHRMNDTRSADTDALAVLAEEYMALIGHQRVDDLKFFFGIFAEKVYKNDKVLKRAMEHLLSTGTITKLAGHTISAMLLSMSQIRFTYYQTLKKFLLGISEEQWAQLDAATIATIVQSMGKLSLRLPAVLVHLGERLVVVYKLLQPVDIAVVLAGLQALGYNDEAVLSLLMQHAASNAKRFDDVALAVFWSAPHVHRLLTDADTAVPLLTQTSANASGASPALQQKIVASVKKSALPREVIQSAVLKLAPAEGLSAQVLQLEDKYASLPPGVSASD